MWGSRIFAGAKEKLPCSWKPDAEISSWSYDVEGHAKKCVERHCELTNKTTQQLYKVTTTCFDDHQFKEELGSVGELPQVLSQIVMKCLYLARIGRPDILWSVNKLAPAITKWTRACDKCLARLIPYIQHTCEFKQYCHVGNTAQQCRLGLCQDSDFAEILKTQNRPQGEFCAYWQATRLFPQAGCVRNEPLFRTVQRNLKFFLLMHVCVWTVFLLLIFGIWLLKCYILLPTNQRNTKRMCRETCRMTHHQENKPRTKLRIQLSTTILYYATSIMFLQTWSLLNQVRWFTFLKITKQWSRWSSRAQVQQWDMYPGPTELLLIGCFTELIWTPKFKSNMSTPNTHLQTYWQERISHAMSGTICFIRSISAFSVQQAAPERCRQECNKEQGKRELWQSRSRRCTWSPRSAASSPTAPSSSASSRPGILRAPSQQGSNLIAQCAGKPSAGGSNQNDVASSPQVWLTDAKLSERARKLAAADTNLDQNFPEHARKLAAENLDINDENDSKWPHNLRVSRANTPHLETNSRRQHKREPEDKMEDLNVNTFIWRRFVLVTQQALVHLGKDYLGNLQSTKNLSQRTMKQLFDVTRKWVSEQTEIQGISLINWQENSWKRTTLLTARAVRL